MATLFYKRMRSWLIVLAALIVPGSGHVLLGRPVRGLLILFWMILFGYLTFQLSSEKISFIGRFAGGFAVWVISAVEVYRLAKGKRDI